MSIKFDPLDQLGAITVCGHPGRIIWRYWPNGKSESDTEPIWTVGWKVSAFNKEYGDWLTAGENPDVEQAEAIMIQHATKSIELVVDSMGMIDVNRCVKCHNVYSSAAEHKCNL